MKKIKTFAFVIPWDVYAKQRADFFKEHPDCTVLHDVETLQHIIMEDETLRIRIPNAPPTAMIILTWGIIIEETEPEKIKR